MNYKWEDFVMSKSAQGEVAQQQISTPEVDKAPRKPSLDFLKPKPLTDPKMLSLVNDKKMRYFNDEIVPYLKSQWNGGQKPGMNYGAAASRRLKVMSAPLWGGAGAYGKNDAGEDIMTFDSLFEDEESRRKIEKILGRKYEDILQSIQAHEMRHYQNEAYGPVETRNESENAALNRAYGFTPATVAATYGLSADWGRGMPLPWDRLAREEAAATNAQYQWNAFLDHEKSLGRLPSPKEFLEHIKGMSIPEGRRLRSSFGPGAANSYDWMARRRNDLEEFARKHGYESYDMMRAAHLRDRDMPSEEWRKVWGPIDRAHDDMMKRLAEEEMRKGALSPDKLSDEDIRAFIDALPVAKAGGRRTNTAYPYYVRAASIG